jgi:hypothetical protein
MDQLAPARVVVLAGQGLYAEELAARCAGPQWDVAAYSDAYAAAADLLRAAHAVLVFAPQSIRPWQKPLIVLARRRGIPVLACGGHGLCEAEKASVHVVKPEDLGEFITAGLAGTLEEPSQEQAEEAADEPRDMDAEAGQVADQEDVEDVEEPEEAQAPTAAQGAQEEPHQGEPQDVPGEKGDGGAGAHTGPARAETFEPSAGQLLTPDEIAALLKSDHE